MRISHETTRVFASGGFHRVLAIKSQCFMTAYLGYFMALASWLQHSTIAYKR
jgi:hypothetical protein